MHSVNERSSIFFWVIRVTKLKSVSEGKTRTLPPRPTVQAISTHAHTCFPLQLSQAPIDIILFHIMLKIIPLLAEHRPKKQSMRIPATLSLQTLFQDKADK